jgi:hypothetical protein
MEVSVRVRDAGRSEKAVIHGPPPPRPPTRGEVEETHAEIDEALKTLSGSVRTRCKARLTQLTQDLREALFYEDQPRAIQRMAELLDLRQQVERERNQVLDPPWPRFTQLVHRCHDLVDGIVELTGRPRAELADPIHAHLRYAERAYQEKNQALYRECWVNLERYASSLEDLRRASTRNEAEEGEEWKRDPEDDARAEAERFRHYLAAVWKQAHARGRTDLDERLGRIARQGQGLALPGGGVEAGPRAGPHRPG